MRRALVLFVAVVALGISSVAHADIISQGFEDTTTFPLDATITSTTTGSGTLGSSATTDGLWRLNSASGPATPYPVIVNNQAHSGTQSVYQLRRTTSGGQSALQVFSDNAASSGIVEATAWYRKNSSSSAICLFLGNHVNTMWGTGALAGYYIGGASLYPIDLASSDWGSAIAGVSIPESAWFGLRIVADLDKHTHDLWYNSGTSWTEVASDVPNGTGTGGTNSMTWFPASGGMWTDDVGLRVVAEPATSMLLTTGLIGLLCYAWRKRR